MIPDGYDVIGLERRLTKIETHVDLKFSALDTALVLARENAEDQRKEAKRANDSRLEHMNEFQKRMDRLEGTFATKEQLQSVSRLVYIGVGIVLAVQALFYFAAK